MIQIKLITNSGRENPIVAKNSTIRACLEENSIDYHVATPSLDGYTLRGAELDKTFAELGAVDGTILSCVIKTDNAAKAKVVGNVVVVESTAKLEDLKLIQKYRPKTLTMMEGEGANKTPVFKVALGGDENGAMSNVGVSFSTRTTIDGKATVTLPLPKGAEASKETVEDMIGGALLKLSKMEEGYAATIEEIKAEQTQVREHIVIA